ncbi:hypothetical protein LQ564_05340 [Massilia sp. G4R7]|uniref:Lipoprotein n=1 Tax=Massilia phyllostachyos TaxID=2898585 RepID=A0ABS8Q544_9BURK|nr:hypothetical protein [Massilia phyllostachyos]MCD2515735.1 hypothetical protein [Massilia phyllostachyos]
MKAAVAGFAVASAACLATAGASACQPLPSSAYGESLTKVKSRFDGARFVVLAELTRVEEVMVPAGDGDFRIEVERATFRVQQAFKGELAKGAAFHVDSGVTACGRGVRHGQWVSFSPGKPTRPRAAPPERWLIYYTPWPAVPGQREPIFEIDDSTNSQPAQWAAYDLEMLGKHAKGWRTAGR